MILLDILRNIEYFDMENLYGEYVAEVPVIINKEEYDGRIIQQFNLISIDLRKHFPDNFRYFLSISLKGTRYVAFSHDWKEAIFIETIVSDNFIIFDLNEIKEQDVSFLILKYGKILQKQVEIS